MRSSSLGGDRMMFVKCGFDALPFPYLDKIDIQDRQALITLADRLENDAEKPWDEFDVFLFRLFLRSKSQMTPLLKKTSRHRYELHLQ
jgi:hypothetical protein